MFSAKNAVNEGLLMPADTCAGRSIYGRELQSRVLAWVRGVGLLDGPPTHIARVKCSFYLSIRSANFAIEESCHG